MEKGQSEDKSLEFFSLGETGEKEGLGTSHGPEETSAVYSHYKEDIQLQQDLGRGGHCSPQI